METVMTFEALNANKNHINIKY